MIKKFEQFNENIKYNLYKDDYINVDEQKHITELYVTQIEKASQSKVIEINGSVSESDCDLYFTLSDDIEIIVNFISKLDVLQCRIYNSIKYNYKIIHCTLID